MGVSAEMQLRALRWQNVLSDDVQWMFRRVYRTMMWSECARQGHFGPLERHLPKPPRVVLGFRRLRLSRLLDQLEPADIAQLRPIIEAGIFYSWGYGRITSTCIARLAYNDADWNDLRRLLVECDAWQSQDTEYIAITKEKHEQWKKDGKAELMAGKDFEHVRLFLYAHELVCRGNWAPKLTVEQEAVSRQTSAIERTSDSGTASGLTREAYLAKRRQILSKLVAQNLDEIVRVQTTVEEYK
eukprot:3456803-Amphidinium_carterae.1